MANLLSLGRALDINGYIAPGAKGTVYAAGTSTLLPIYSDVAGTVAAANPMIADGNGFWPQRFVTASAKVVVTDADDAAIVTWDPAPIALGTGSAASEVSFSPTVPVPFTDVQAAVEGVAASVLSGVTSFGIGITGNAGLLAALDATNIASGVYRFDGTTTGTYPTGVAAADTGLIEHWRQSATVAMQSLFHATTTREFTRRMTAGAWGAWREDVNVNIGATRGDIIRFGTSTFNRLALGADGTVLQSNGTDAVWGGVGGNAASVALTGSTLTLTTAIPSAARRVIIGYSGMSTNGTQDIGIRAGAGAILTSGYESGAHMPTISAGTSTNRLLLVATPAAASVYFGVATLTRQNGDVWFMSASTVRSSDGLLSSATGNITVAGGINRVALVCATDTFDAGTGYATWDF